MGDNKSAAIKGMLIEISVAGMLVILILGTLNYFNILPLSQTFPFLSVLPSQQKAQVSNNPSIIQRQSSNSPQSATVPAIKVLVESTSPKKFSNSASQTSIKYLEDSYVLANYNRSLGIDIDMTISGSSSSSSGISLGENIYSNSLPRISLYYFSQANSWLLSEDNAGEKKYTTLAKVEKDSIINGKFTLLISRDGKTIKVQPPAGNNITINLSRSLYGSKRSLTITTLVAPNSSLNLNYLRYTLQ